MNQRITVTRPSLPTFEEYSDEIASIFKEGTITNNGPKLQLFKEMLKEYLEVESIALFVNGHMALEMTLQAYEFPPGSEVITTPFTFISTTHAIVRNNLKPVFCDISDSNYCLNASMIEPLITARTVAIVPVHVYGNICDVESIDRIAEKYRLRVIYDAAHAFGERARIKNQKMKSVGNFGDASVFSFHATKVFNSIEGGAVCFRQENLEQRLADLCNFGIRDQLTTEYIGANAKMNEFQAAMGICNLRHINRAIEQRKFLFERYAHNLGNSSLVLNRQSAGIVSNYAYFPVLFQDEREREAVFFELQKNDIFARRYFYPIITEASVYKGTFTSDTPVAESLSKRVLTLPLYADLNFEDLDHICKIVRGVI